MRGLRLKSTTHDEPGRHGAIEHGMGRRIWRIWRTRPTAWLRTSHAGNGLFVAIRSTDTPGGRLDKRRTQHFRDGDDAEIVLSRSQTSLRSGPDRYLGWEYGGAPCPQDLEHFASSPSPHSVCPRAGLKTMRRGAPAPRVELRWALGRAPRVATAEQPAAVG